MSGWCNAALTAMNVGLDTNSHSCLQVEIEKPLGLKLKASKAVAGGCVVAVCSAP